MEVGSYIGSEDGARPKVVGSIPTWVIRFGQATIWDASLRGLIWCCDVILHYWLGMVALWHATGILFQLSVGSATYHMSYVEIEVWEKLFLWDYVYIIVT